jgi:hypothetical protein
MPVLTSIPDFVAGQVLTAAQMDIVNCGVKVFASNTTRDAAYGGTGERTLEEGEVCYVTATDELQVYDGSRWVNAAPLDNRNVIINGEMQIAQRSTSVTSITSGGYNTVDRFKVSLTSLGTWTNDVQNDAPTGSGFRKSLRWLCTTADAAPASTDVMIAQTTLEGQNLQQFLKGTSSAKQFTISFWVKSNAIGTYICELIDQDNNRTVSAAYTISASATWEKKIITFPADTTGAFDNDNGGSLDVNFFLGAGSTYTSGTLQTTWATTTSANRAVGQTNLAANTNNYWQLTGVQLEAGSVVSPFEFEDISTTIAKCQRYYEKSYNIDVNPGTANAGGAIGLTQDRSMQDGGGYYRSFGTVQFAVTKRAAPTISFWSQAGTSAKYTTNRAGNAGTAGFYNLYVATSADSNTVLAYDIGQKGFTISGQSTTISTASTLDFGVVHYVSEAEF